MVKNKRKAGLNLKVKENAILLFLKGLWTYMQHFYFNFEIKSSATICIQKSMVMAAGKLAKDTGKIGENLLHVWLTFG